MWEPWLLPQGVCTFVPRQDKCTVRLQRRLWMPPLLGGDGTPLGCSLGLAERKYHTRQWPSMQRAFLLSACLNNSRGVEMN